MRRSYGIVLVACWLGCSSSSPVTGDDGGAGDGGACGSAVALAPGLVVTDKGAVQGRMAGATWTYQGIPYAAAPVGDLRFREPMEHACWSDVLDASSFGPECPQLDANNMVQGNEDCLSLNVWTPASPPAQPLPVMFFIHGGGNTQGASSATTSGTAIYDAQYIVEHQPVVVVTINYRLGVLGFLTATALDAESPQHASGNYGILDQIAALKWVKRNIAAFGGDPSRVLVFGESAGAVDTCIHLASPLSAGLFSSALMESGGCTATPIATEETQDQMFIQAAGCSGASDVAACLRALSASDTVTKLPGLVSVTGLGTGPKYGPVVDGWVLPTGPYATILAGQHNQVPFVVGSNSDETSRYAPMIADAQAYADLIHQQFGQSIGDQVLAQYPAASFPTPRAAYVAVTTDARFVCEARLIAKTAAAHQMAPVYRYLFSHALDNAPMLQPLGAWHGLELLWVFHQLGVAGYMPSMAELALSDAIIGYWARFAGAGDPNGGGAPSWPVYVGATDDTLDLDDAITTVNGVRTARCDFWESLL
jgi:para-nitrobenzyl esterase